jgi:hypothetical protein
VALDRITTKACLAVATSLKEEFAAIERNLKGIGTMLENDQKSSADL